MITFLILIIVALIVVIIYLLIDRNKSINLKDEVIIDNTEEENEQQPEILNKKYAIKLINKEAEGNPLSSINTSYSKINKAVPLWWFNISPEKFESDLNLILAHNDGFIWVFLPEGSVTNPKRKFRFREDKGLIELKISTQTGYNYLRDESSGGIGFGFEQFIKKKFKI